MSPDADHTDEEPKRVRDERGASAVEYAIMVAAIAAVVTVVVIALGLSTADLFSIPWP